MHHVPSTQPPSHASAPTRTWQDRLATLYPAALLVLGSFLFLTGGRAHPGIRASPEGGAEAFFRAFADTVHHTPGWHGMHMMILVGPLFWAVAAPWLLGRLDPRGVAAHATARSLLLLSGCLWATAFVLDGFGAPVYARALTSTAADPALLAAFAANAVMMSRLGLVSWVVGGLGIVALSATLLSAGVRTKWRAAVGLGGLLIGLWPLLAALEGEYAGGPFTSRFWMHNALLAGLWYIALAGCAFGEGTKRSDVVA